MELKIISPQEGGFVKEIQWNNEELKAEIGAKMDDYKGLVFTEDAIKEAKKDRAKLNKLRTAFEDERKRVKNLCMRPYNVFEQQVKEVVSLIDEPIRFIDVQIKEVEEKKRAQKREDIEALFQSIGFQRFVTLDQIFDNKWLNATVSMNTIEEQMKSRMYQIGTGVATISRLPEFSFEAMEVYKETLDINRAIQEGQRLADIQKRKVEQEEVRRKAEEDACRKATEQSEVVKSVPEEKSVSTEVSDAVREEVPDPLHIIDFRVIATAEQLNMLKEFLINHGIQYEPVPKKGE